MARRRKPGLTPEDREIWERVASSVTPLAGPAPVATGRKGLLASATPFPGIPGQAEPAARAEPPPMPKAEPQAPLFPNRFRIGMAARPAPPRHDLLPSLPERLAAAPKVDGGIQAKLRRGKLRPEARIDLHGMTLSEAHPALTGFLIEAHAAGRRLVLVITGKGKDRDDGTVLRAPRGVLRHQVPSWVQTGMLAAIVLQITPAHISHGGEGAYYVYLKRRR